MAFSFAQKVLFKHCDPAGIVFYPRYFEMMNDCVEAFFDAGLGMPFEELHTIGGVPTANIQTKFTAPSRHGDHLILSLTITQIGGSSATYHLSAHCDTELRFETEATLVFISPQGKPAAWPDSLRQGLMHYKDPNS